MPTYDYRCNACKHEFEHYQSMKDKPLKKCPECGKPALERLIGTGAAVIFKGSGFYQTDYRSESYKKSADADKPTTTDAAPKPESTPEPKANAKPDTPPDTKRETKREGKPAAPDVKPPKPESKVDPKPEPKPAAQSPSKSAAKHSKPAPSKGAAKPPSRSGSSKGK